MKYKEKTKLKMKCGEMSKYDENKVFESFRLSIRHCWLNKLYLVEANKNIKLTKMNIKSNLNISKKSFTYKWKEVMKKLSQWLEAIKDIYISRIEEICWIENDSTFKSYIVNLWSNIDMN